MEEVYHTLIGEGYCCMTFIECEGTGKYSDHSKEHISEKYSFADAYRVIKLEVLVEDADVQKLIPHIRKSARTGYQGDGMILVSPVEDAFKVKTDEKGFDVI
ncbi:MAG: P-II family nitrogen regulator [Melioribacteraceae bacterium]|nr:P-II family nitrogen regulator [Melioribacteraceae bacterium]